MTDRTAAERARRYRDRLRGSRTLMQAELPLAWAISLVDAGYLDGGAVRDPRRVGEAFIIAIENGWRPHEKNITP